MTSRYIILFAACAIAFGFAAMPLSALMSLIGLERFGITAGRVEGTIWNGNLKDVYWRNYAMGEVGLSPNPLTLLKGQLSVDLTVDDGPVRARGTLSRSLFSDVILQDAVVSANIAGLPVLLQLSGQVEVEVAYLRYGRKGCLDVKATLKTDALARGFAGLSWAGPTLTGQMRCENNVLVLPLSGAENGQVVSLQMMLKPDRTFDIRVSIDTPDPAVAQVLPALGFRREGNVLVLVQDGRWG